MQTLHLSEASQDPLAVILRFLLEQITEKNVTETECSYASVTLNSARVLGQLGEGLLPLPGQNLGFMISTWLCGLV